MQFSDWCETDEGRRRIPEPLVTLIGNAMRTLGVPLDAPAHVIWGDQPGQRFMVMLACDAGLAILGVRPSTPQEGPRVSGRLLRWSRVQVGELAIEAHHGHVQASAQMEGQVLQGLDAAGAQVAGWMAEVYRRVEGASRAERSS